MTRYKYYFKKPRSEIVKDVLSWLVIGGAVCIAATSPYFILNLMKGFKNSQRYEKKKVYDTFYKLRKQGCIDIKKRNHQIYIALTEKGRKRAGRFQIDSLKIEKPQKWDGKWRIVIFDISQLQITKREAFRGKLKELGFYPLQKSVWIHPFNCQGEIDLLREFFGLGQKEIRLIVAQTIGDDTFFKKIFKIT